MVQDYCETALDTARLVIRSGVGNAVFGDERIRLVDLEAADNC